MPITYTEYSGIDYGRGKTNIAESGIRYGVIHQNHVLQAWADSSEPDYGEVTCVECGEPIPDDGECSEHGCNADDFHDLAEVQHFVLADEGYEAISDDSGDIFVTKSPYYTYAQFCSPCAPGACYLTNPLETVGVLERVRMANNRAYCFGHDWFDEGVAPYRVFRVGTGEEVFHDNP